MRRSHLPHAEAGAFYRKLSVTMDKIGFFVGFLKFATCLIRMPRWEVASGAILRFISNVLSGRVFGSPVLSSWHPR